MALPNKATTFEMLPYRRQGRIDYASLDFDPDVVEVPPDAMEQNLELTEIEKPSPRPSHRLWRPAGCVSRSRY